MKRVLIIVTIFIVCMFMFNTSLYAACMDTDLNDWAEKLEVKFVQVTDKYLEDNNYTDSDLPFSYLLMLNNPREDIKVVAKDTGSGGTYNVDYDKNFKNYVIGSEVHFTAKTYTITVYMTDSNIACPGEKMRTITYKVPKYNSYNDTLYCDENPKSDICGSYKEVDEDKVDELDKLVDRYYKDKVKDEIYKYAPWYEKAWIIVKEYSLYVLIPLASVSIVYGAVIYVTKKRREKE